MEQPRRAVPEDVLEGLQGEDMRHNYRTVLRFRERLLAAGTLERCYVELFRAGVDVPPLFVDQMAHVILRGVLEGCDDPLELRAGELFFREQKATIRDGHALLADQETVEMHASGARYGSLGRLIVEAQGATASAALEVLDRANAQLYWARESRHDLVISLTYGRPALDALCRVMQRWVRHFLALEVRIRPLRRIEEARWAWHVGLDAEATSILNALWQGEEVDAGRMRRILALFSLEFADATAMRPEIAGRAVYLALAANADDVVKMKPQNLILNLPRAEA